MDDHSLTSQELVDIKVLHREISDKRQADHVKAVVLLGSGWTPSQVAQVLLIDRTMVRRYCRDFKKGGVTRLLETNYTHHRGYLSLERERELDTYLQEHLHITAKSVIAYVAERWDIHYSESGMTDLLHRLGYVYKTPKLVPGKADAQAQEAFLEGYEKLKETKAKEDVILFTDAVHPQHNPVMASGWIKQGKNFQICSNTGRQRLNINGAASLETLNLVMRYDDTINADSTIKLFEQIYSLRSRIPHYRTYNSFTFNRLISVKCAFFSVKSIQSVYPEASRIMVVCDNARYYRSKCVKAYLEDARIELMFLPPYAPDLNLIDRYWKYFKKIILYNRYYETFQEFKQACIDFFDNPDEHWPALRSLLAENFQIIDGHMGYA